MDTLTHTVLGAVTGDLTAGKRLGKKAMLWGALANNLPDIDVLTSPYMSIPDGLLAHRGFTHSYVFSFIAAPVLALALRRVYKSHSFAYRNWLFFFLTQLVIHNTIDWHTAYGTALLEPFTHNRYSLNVIFVADPFFTLPLIIGSIALLIAKKNSKYRVKWSVFSITLTLCYLCYSFSNKYEVSKVLKYNVAEKKMNISQSMSTPTPLNNFLWYIVCKSDSGFYISHYSVFDQNKILDFEYVHQQDSLKKSVSQQKELEKLIRFSQGYYCLVDHNDTITFNDMRFGQIGGWYRQNAPFVFQYKLNQEADNDIVIQRGRIQASSAEAIREMTKRIVRDL